MRQPILRPAAICTTLAAAACAAPAPPIAAVESVRHEEITPNLRVDAPLWYPRNAYLRGQEGSVTVKYSINELGLVDKSVVISSAPPKIFDEKAQQLLRYRIYVPMENNGVPMRSPPMTETIAFHLDEAVFQPRLLSTHRPAYPPVAEQLGLEGQCDMQLLLDKDGTVLHVNMLARDPFNEFAPFCRGYAQTLKYEPNSPNQNPPISRSARLILAFRMAAQQSIKPLLAPGEWIKMGYDINAQGLVENARILAGNSSERARRTALDILRIQIFPNETDPAKIVQRKAQTMVLISPSKPPEL